MVTAVAPVDVVSDVVELVVEEPPLLDFEDTDLLELPVALAVSLATLVRALVLDATSDTALASFVELPNAPDS